jgi:hypothetical protein
MNYLPFSSRVGKVCALVATALVLPVLAYAGQGGNSQGDNGQGDNGQGGNGQGGNGVATVPDAGPGIVLLAATIGTILVFSLRRSARKSA